MRNRKYHSQVTGHRSLFIVFCLLFTVHCSLFAHAYATEPEKKIRAIDVTGVRRIKPEDLIAMICLGIGDPVDRGVLQAGIKRAFKKGIFIDIKAETEPFQDGLKLKYTVIEMPVINRIRITGNKLIKEKDIKTALLLKTGEDLREEFLKKAETAVLNLYRKKGFPEAKIKIKANRDKVPYRVNLHVFIEEGSPLIIKTIFAPGEIKSIMKVSEGSIFDTGLIDKDIINIRKHYKESGYLKPVVGPYEFRDSELLIPFSPGQRLEITLRGNTVIGAKELLKELPFMEDEEVTDKLVEDATNLIKRLYWQRGYNHVVVAGGIETTDDLIKIAFFIFEGKKVILKDIKFEGITIPAKNIETIIPLQREQPFDESLVDSSTESIISFYNGLGYLDTEIKEARKDFPGDIDELTLTFAVHEGVQTKIEKVNITGAQAVGSDEIIKAVRLKESAPYNALDVEDARYKILSLYNHLGYADAHVESETATENGRAFITFKITGGRPSTIGKIIIRGNKKTKDKIIKREFDIKEGDSYDHEKLIRAKQQLYRLGLFSEVTIEILAGTSRETTNIKDILVTVKEGNAGAVDVGLGYGDYEGFRGFLDLSYRNLGGYNRQAGFRTELNSLERRYILSFKEPWFFNKPQLPLKLSLTSENKQSINIDTRETKYEIDRTSLLAGVDRELTERLKATLNYEYSIVTTYNVEPGVILSKDDTGTLGISSISPALFYDTRDNPFDPTAGSFKGIVVKIASKTFLSETEFIKATLQGAWFLKIRTGLVFACSLRGGGAYGLGETSDLPLIERFFLGGRTTVRGYNQDTLGPKGADNTPTGGNAFALGNAELRASIGKGLGIVAFVDSGNVWQDTNDINFELKYTAGLGLRYNTPVGPFRLDYGQKINKEEGESSGELHFSLGHAF